VALKKPSEYFKKDISSLDNTVQELVQKPELGSFSEAFDSFKNNLSNIEVLSEKVEDIQTEIQTLLKKEDLDRAMMSQLLILEQSIRDVQNKVSGINEKNLREIRNDVSGLTESVNEFLEKDVPKYKKLVVESELRTGNRFIQLEENVNQTLDGILEFVGEKYSELTESLHGINEQSLSEIVKDFKLLENLVQQFKEEDIPKYKNFIANTEIKTENKLNKFQEKLDETVSSILEKVSLIEGDNGKIIDIVNEKIDDLNQLSNQVRLTEKIIKESKKELTEKVSDLEIDLEVGKKELTEKVSDLEDDINRGIIEQREKVEDYKKEIEKKVSDLEIEIVRNESHIKVQNKNLEQIQEDIKSAIGKLNLQEIEKQNHKLGKKIKYLEEVFEKFSEKEILTENIFVEPSSTDNKDPLTPLDQNFVTLDQLQQHYRLFINRIQQQLATIGGGGETKLKYLDDVVGIATNGSAYDGKFLTYDYPTDSFEFKDVPEPAINLAEENVVYVAKDGSDSNPGTLSKPKLTIKAAVESIVSAGTTDIVVRVAPGTYIEDNPITLPDEVTVMGHSLRETTVIPQNDDKDLFYIGNGNYVAEMSFRGSLRGKAIFAFDPVDQRYIVQSPYIQNCTNFIPDSIGMRIDGKDAIGPLKSMVLDSYTQYNQGGIGVSITNEAYAQLVSLFTICDDIAVYVGSGAGCDLTNSNSSFGNFGLVADGVSGKKYTGIVTVAAAEQNDTYVVNLSTPTLNVVDATYNNETGRIKVVTNEPHQFNVGMAVTLAGLGFTCDFEPGIREYPSGKNGYVFNVETVAPGRYLDAANLIQANKAEIQDKSLASIALNHPDFIFPGDPSDDSRYRFYDSYRLVQKNKQEIVDKSLAAVAIAHSDFYFPDDDQTNIRSRYYDSYRLIQNNREVITNLAWTDLSSTYPEFSYTESKCKRDIGFFIDAVSTDVFTGGNNYAREFVLQYFDGTTPIGIAVTERTPTVYAFEQARDYMKQAITNTLVGAAYSDLTLTVDPLTGSNTDANSCADVQSNIDNLVGIVTVSVGSGNTTSLPVSPNLGYFNLSVGIGTTVSPGGVKCARDLGFLTDAVSTDLFIGGNKYSRNFARQYFDNSGNPITNGLLGEENESITAFNALRDYSKKAITNQLNYKEVGISSGPAVYGGAGGDIPVLPSGNPDSCTDVQDAINTLVGIVTSVIGSGSLTILNTFTENTGTFTDVGSICRRDIGYIVDSVTQDLIGFTNLNIIDATKKYFTYDGVLDDSIETEIPETITAFNSARDYMKLALNNQLNSKDLTVLAGVSSIGQGGPIIPIEASGSPDACADVRYTVDTLVEIITTNLDNGDLSALPNVSLASTIFTVDVGIATQSHYYNSGGEVKINIVRPYDGQSVYFNDLYYSIKTLNIIDGGSGYTELPTITIEEPDTPWGVRAQALPILENGVLIGVDMLSNGRGYRTAPKVTISAGINTAVATSELSPEYYTIQKATEITNDISIITLNEVVPYEVGIGTEVKFFKQSRILATGHSFEFIGSGTDITTCLPFSGGTPPNPDNETDARDGGLVVYSSTNQAGNFKIGDGVIINQNTGSISGQSYSKSLLSSMTPYILSLGGF